MHCDAYHRARESALATQTIAKPMFFEICWQQNIKLILKIAVNYLAWPQKGRLTITSVYHEAFWDLLLCTGMVASCSSSSITVNFLGDPPATSLNFPKRNLPRNNWSTVWPQQWKFASSSPVPEIYWKPSKHRHLPTVDTQQWFLSGVCHRMVYYDMPTMLGIIKNLYVRNARRYQWHLRYVTLLWKLVCVLITFQGQDSRALAETCPTQWVTFHNI